MRRFVGNKAVFAVLIALFLAVSMGGVFVLCSMSPMEHLSEWQGAFSAILSMLSIFVAFHYFVQDFLIPKQTRVVVLRKTDTGRVFDPLRLAFARGILNTKAY